MHAGIALAVLLVAAGLCRAGDPVVSNVRASQRGGGSKLVDIYYDVADSDGDRQTVSVAITDGGTPIPATSLTGAVGADVTPGAGKRIVWDAGADWPGQLSENVRATVTADDGRTGSGLYMVVDLSGGPSAPIYPVSYLTAVPSGGWTDTYKTTKLVLRKIPKGTFTMGSPSGEFGRDSDETQHTVTLTKDFYIGVFEVTQRQWELVMGTKPIYFNNATYYASRPVEQVSYFDIRENPANSAITPNWPQSNQVHADSFMGKLRAKTGLSTFDLPTESQWEYACRAGTGTPLNSGKNLTAAESCPNMSEVGRYWYNGGSGYSQGCAPSAGTALAGSYLPNAWGLYDMHGNVWEWCLDWYGAYPGSVQDPDGAASGLYRVGRGGGWGGLARGCRSADRGSYWDIIRDVSIGFRAARTLP
jgi:formylglycine-generating enzyme required for sulfatase activity